MTKIDWDHWRADYDSMSWDDQIAFYEQVFREHPSQKFFTASAVSAFLTLIGPVKVLEIGGWMGELARAVYGPNIIEWLNVEVIRKAEKVRHGDWYRAIVPDDYIWWVGLPIGYDVLVMSHTIEHIRAWQLELLIQQFEGKWVYLEAPLQDDGVWDGYDGTHILEIGWKEVDAIMLNAGFSKLASSNAAFHSAAQINTYHRG